METIDTSKIEALLYQLVQQGNEDSRGGAAFAATTSEPMQRRMVQAPPQPFSNPVLNMGFNAVAPMVASHISGGRPMQSMPQFTPGVGAYESFYARDITTPLYETGRQILAQNQGAGMAMTVARMSDKAGLRPKGMSSSEFIESAANLGATTGGQLAAGALMSTNAMQSLMGGDPRQIYDAMFPRMQKLSTAPGQLVDPTDIGAQTRMAEDTARYALAVENAIFSDPVTGQRGIVPNTEFTRGHSMSDIAAVSAYMADRNFSYDVPGEDAMGNPVMRTVSMRGEETSADEKKRMLGDQLAVLDTVGSVMNLGAEDIAAKIETLEKFTQGKAANINPEVLRGSLDNIASMAVNLSISSKEMMNTILATQASLSTVAGGTIDPQGNSRSAYAGPMVAQYAGEQVQTIAQLSGRKPQDVMQEQMALRKLGHESGQGKAMKLIEYMRETGQVDEELYQKHVDAINTGDKGAQEQAMREIFSGSVYGSAENAMRVVNDPNFMKFIEDSTSDTGALQVTQLLDTAQEREMPERRQDMMMQTTERLQRMALADQGVSMDTITNTPENAKRQVQALQEHFKALGTPEGDALAGMLQDQYSKGKDPKAGLANVRGILSTAPFKEHAKSAMSIMQQERIAAVGGYLESGAGQEAAEMSSRIRFMKGAFASDTDSARRNSLYEAEKALRGGDSAKAEQIIAEQEKTLTASERAGMELQLDKDAGINRRRVEAAKDTFQGGDEAKAAGLVAAQTESAWGAYGLTPALAERRDTKPRLEALSEAASEGALMRRQVGDAAAGQRGTIGQKLVKWMEGRGSVYDVLGVQMLEGETGALTGMSPEQVAALRDKDIAKMDPKSKKAAEDIRAFMQSDAGKAQMAHAAATMKAAEFSTGALAGTEFAGQEARLATMSDDEFKSQVNRRDRKKLQAARDFYRSDEGAKLLQLDPAALRSDRSSGRDKPKLNEDAEKEKDRGKTKQGKGDTMKITGSVTLRNSGGGVMGTMDYDGAEVKLGG